MAHVILRDIWKSFDGEEALQGLSFECQEGEFFCLLGPSGAGKSTTIRVISGLEKPDKGDVFLGGEKITNRFPQQRNVATAFESYALYPHLTVFDNLAFPLRAPIRSAQYTDTELKNRVVQVANMLNIGELLERYPRQLSGGQRQRVALGRALVRKPRLYLLDEPIAHLDAKLRHHMRGELRKIQLELGITTLYATPDQLEALSMADTVAVINKGRIEQIGSGDDLYYRPVNLFVAGFVGDPPMNFLPANRQNGSLSFAAGFQLPIPEADRPLLGEHMAGDTVTVGIRPKDIRPVPESASEANLRGRVLDLDTLGQSTVVSLDIGAANIKMKVSTDDAPERDSQIGLVWDTSQLHYFDPQTDRRLGA